MRERNVGYWGWPELPPERIRSNYKDQLEDAFRAIRAKHPCPEDIGLSAGAFDQSAAQAPSRRIMALYPAYDKVWHGSLIALDIGLPTIRKHCPHFDLWLSKLEKLASREALITKMSRE